MDSNIYKHKGNGKWYAIVSDNFMFKDNINDKLEWRKGLILYKALYECPDGPYFARTKEDFDNEFTRITLVRIDSNPKREIILLDYKPLDEKYVLVDNLGGFTYLSEELIKKLYEEQEIG